MVALVFADAPGANDSPEIKQYKAQVKEVAQRYGKQHNMCGVLNKALKEIGIEDEKPVLVTATTVPPLAMTFQVKALPSTLSGKTEDEQKAIVAGLIGQVSLAAGKNVTLVNVALTAETIATLAVSDKPAVPDTPVGYTWKFTSEEGRVKHLFSNDQRRSWRGYTALCGTEAYVGTSLTSKRSEDRNCKNCENKVPGLTN